ncbi:enoyl-CoA hydratase/isomerase family protein (plasmid) [Pseudorhodobacter turbinis]|uniref:3-hydroxyisobutyryl-CoA hydrolase n=1 Tax=Pseudorhodobacter turbinis TaxID=2500533 RepID=A0A4P8EIK5_9RHOB|nr:enoyl-CoA hydratase/isomerase family protein [Pseudorhodobacter turbinis]QCO56788.1 enoyl-CoA hydratase/isomerase family protein [Pseudorhodobacter turbinis]
MSDTKTWIERRCGRIRLNRPNVLNALSEPMCEALDAALIAWAEDDAVDLVVIDAEGPRAFCAGGDIAELYHAGKSGDFGHGRHFWRMEYRMNLRIARYAKPVVSLMHGFTMGGGVGVGCHARHRIVGESSQLAMPECAIGLVPDVGGSYLLARAPGRLGAYLAATGARMGPGDAIYAGFADYFVPESDWPALTAALVAEGISALVRFTQPAPDADLPDLQTQVDTLFGAESCPDVVTALRADDSDFAQSTLEIIERASPLATCAALEIQNRLRAAPDLSQALELEYRYTHSAQESGDFQEGVRATVIDKDRSPNWLHKSIEAVPAAEVTAMLAPLGSQAWTVEDDV